MASDKTILLEIGTEEIPARFLPAARKTIADNLTKLLSDNSIGHNADDIQVYATPRRLAILMNKVSDMQSDRTREAYGPPKKAAYDKDGNPTKAATGFARSQGVEAADLEVRPKEGKGEYLYIAVDEKGRPTQELLPDIFRELILTFPFPKSMHWGDGSITYARPIHWVVALFGDKVMEFELEGIKSGNKSRGHRFLAPVEIELDGPDKYVSKLKEKFVVVDQAERVKTLESQCAELAKSVSAKPFYMEPEHPLIVADLVEYPQAVLGSFETDYLELPDELLNSVMWGHQKYFSIVNDDGKNVLKNYFIIVSNTVADNAETVRRGAERVIRARFDDAVFYYSDDKNTKLSDRLDALKNVTFQDKLGSIYDKVMRLKAVSAKVADLIAPSAKVDAVRAAELAKSDLITGVVGEFPELQGIMGMYYAGHDGESDAVAKAIREQYLPAFSGDVTPSSDAGTVVALSERMDNIVSFFNIDLIPTGSEDPYALRRAAMGIIAIWMQREFKLGELIECGHADGMDSELSAQIQQFIISRVGPILVSQGHDVDTVNALTSGSFISDNPYNDIVSRLEALKAFKSDAAYNDFLTGIKRVRNIAPDELLVEPNEGTETAEKALFNEYKSVAGDVEAMAKKGDYNGAIKAMGKLTAHINTFFDDVLVMDKDEAVKNNRLSLLKQIDMTTASVADFSKLEERS